MKKLFFLLITCFILLDTALGQTNVKLEQALSRSFPTNSQEDNHWVYDPGQSKNSLDSILHNLRCQSENIIKDSSVKKILAAGPGILPIFSKRFTDSAISSVFSKCTGRYLTRGEIALILADQIEEIPYFTLIGLQNCTLESCPGNPNFVEYYLEFIRARGMMNIIQKKYDTWLRSRDRKNHLKQKPVSFTLKRGTWRTGNIAYSSNLLLKPKQ